MVNTISLSHMFVVGLRNTYSECGYDLIIQDQRIINHEKDTKNLNMEDLKGSIHRLSRIHLSVSSRNKLHFQLDLRR